MSELPDRVRRNRDGASVLCNHDAEVRKVRKR